MSVDAKIDSLIEALNRNTEALLKAGGAAGTSASTTADKPGKTENAEKKKETAPKVSQEEMIAALTKLKDDFDVKHAKQIVKDVGGAEKMNDIKPAKFAEVLKAAEAKYAELSAGGSDDDGL